MNTTGQVTCLTDSGSVVMADIDTPGLTVVMDTLGIVPQLVPADALPYQNDTVIAGNDIGWRIQVLQSNELPFDLTNVPGILFYSKVYQTDTAMLFAKSDSVDPSDVVVVSPPTAGNINVFVRAADYTGVTGVVVGTTIFLYVDLVTSTGGTINVSKWTLTISN